MEAIIPFTLETIPIKKLALISFEKDPDSVYRGLELQYLDGLPNGTGWRVIAYRNDHYVDVYDENTLITIENERFDVAEKGLKQHTKTVFHEIRFENDVSGIHICFSFQDLLGRTISVQIHEHSKRQSKAMNLLAPIGAGSENPTSFPLFFLYNFDFVRKHKTKMMIEIEGKKHKADNFPFPITKEFQWRYYTRYSMDCQMIEFAKAHKGILTKVELDDNFSYTDGLTTYFYNISANELSLNKITTDDNTRQLKMIFNPSMPLTKKSDGEARGNFHITTDPAMGTIDGTYHWKHREGVCSITLTPNQGWKSKPNSIITKLILSPKSVFCSWPKSYRYIQEIEMNSLRSKSEWVKGDEKQPNN